METENQKNILWFFEKICLNDKVMTVTQEHVDLILKIFCDFTSLDDLAPLLKIIKNIQFNVKLKNLTLPFS